MARTFALFVAAVLALLTTMVTAQDFPPRPEGPVLDAAGIIPQAQEAALDAKLRAYNRTTGRSIIVATVNSLGGEEPYIYAQGLAEQWDIGGAQTEEAALMLVAPNEREVFITTSRGVQGRLTDISTGRIVQDTILPAFRQGNYAAGISAGATAIMARLDMDPAQAAAIAEAEAAAQRTDRNAQGASVGGIVFWIAMIVIFMLVFGRGGSGGRRRRYGAGNMASNVILWSALGSMMGGRGDGGFGGGFDGGGFGGGGFGGGGFGGFGGGGGGFNGGGAGGGW
ncbi:TPM domain-containing protein [Croceicoccus sp. F390]|uniref:TPM domain-containing protein n=1 Tax=Croceicoccus esteveae TaxID=3075597 RepID=A0ABU2ZGQ8_9SPHN|nr:TPM domain-containing protein [Croceicoccus sp. F390]MDT0575391.1 TPM domain-containing protein [Croceicoccus sp. F390]